jgi:molecular chaperone GrpE
MFKNSKYLLNQLANNSKLLKNSNTNNNINSLNYTINKQFHLMINNSNNSKINNKNNFNLESSISFYNNSKYINNNNMLYVTRKSFFSKKSGSNSEETQQSTKTNGAEADIKEENNSSKKENDSNSEEQIGLKKYNLLKELYEDSESNLQKARSKFDELRKAYVESQSDLERVRKRSEVEIAQAKEFSVTKFAKDMLDVKDNFERALSCLKEIEHSNKTLDEENNKEIKAYKDFAEGVLMTKDSLVRILALHGIKEYNPIKERFDPSKHEAVFQSTSTELSPGTISDVMQTGFTIGNRVLRPAKVGVVKK